MLVILHPFDLLVYCNYNYVTICNHVCVLGWHWENCALDLKISSADWKRCANNNLWFDNFNLRSIQSKVISKGSFQHFQVNH